VSYLDQLRPESALDSRLRPTQAAEVTAFTAFVARRCADVVDLYLLMEDRNWEEAGRGVVARAVGGGVVGWGVVAGLRKGARARVAGMVGRGGMEVEGVEHRVAVSRLCAEVFGVLERRLGPRRYFFDEEEEEEEQEAVVGGGGGGGPCSFDCVCLAFLALIAYPEVPVDWARVELARFPRLELWVQEHREKFLGPFVEAGEVLGGKERGGEGVLPWELVGRGDLLWFLGAVVESVKEGLGFWGVKRVRGKGEEGEEGEEGDLSKAEARRKVEEARRREWWKSVVFVGAAVAGMAGYVFWSGILALGEVKAEAAGAAEAVVEEEEEEEEGEEEEGEEDEDEDEFDDGDEE
jgi:hypothetical protein